MLGSAVSFVDWKPNATRFLAKLKTTPLRMRWGNQARRRTICLHVYLIWCTQLFDKKLIRVVHVGCYDEMGTLFLCMCSYFFVVCMYRYDQIVGGAMQNSIASTEGVNCFVFSTFLYCYSLTVNNSLGGQNLPRFSRSYFKAIEMPGKSGWPIAYGWAACELTLVTLSKQRACQMDVVEGSGVWNV